MRDLNKLSGYINKQAENLSVGAACVILNKGKVLMVENTKSGYWSFPGGHLHEDESLIDCVKREVYEEVGKQITIKAGPIFYQYKLNSELNLLLFFYLAEIENDDSKYSSVNGEIINAKWFVIDQLPDKIYENTQIIIQHFISQI
jgi:8-oxo-dGTP pyrophosphatase MutT (NUDIX family)